MQGVILAQLETLTFCTNCKATLLASYELFTYKHFSG